MRLTKVPGDASCNSGIIRGNLDNSSALQYLDAMRDSASYL